MLVVVVIVIIVASVVIVAIVVIVVSVAIVKSKVTQSLTDYQGHLLSFPGQLKRSSYHVNHGGKKV